MSIYNFTAKKINGEEVNLSKYKGKVLLVVNTASKCGFTPQYEDLEKIYKEYKEQGLEILGFPSNQFAEQEPGNGKEIQEFCKLNYGVSFQLFEKSDVRGAEINPVFNYLTEKTEFKGFDLNHPSGKILSAFLNEKFPHFLEGNSIKWNFTKFLIDREGNIVERFEPTTEPLAIVPHIQTLL